jgi:NAD(P)-dependent dehydrogenase (short-subunit alcohol dehydrogenase family)
MELKGKTAILTGASGQLGGCIARCLAGMGMDCLCHYHTNAEAAQTCAQSIRQMGVKAETVQADFSDPASVSILMERTTTLGPVRVVVNSCSLFKRQPLGQFGPGDVAAMLNVNLAASVNLCNEFAAYLKQEGILDDGQTKTAAAIINMIDVAAVKPWAEYGPYCASRSGMIGLTKSLAKELAPAVTVNAIAPGIVTWPGKMDPSEEQKQLKMIPAGRFGSPEDITRTIEFLLDNDYITGQVICVDGGRSL